MHIHFISIGGSAMHNLAIALHQQGVTVSGSDDQIFEPSRSRLEKYGLLPEREGWDAHRIHAKLDAVILGMHAKKGNPELEKAESMGIPVYSFPSYLYEHARQKTRIVIGGSHGKTTITAMVLHALSSCGVDADYMVGAQLDGFEVMVKLTDSADIMILEGDEYLTSALDPRPKFHVYKPDVALISGIAWDHFNVFPSFEKYRQQFETFINLVPNHGKLVYYEGDAHVSALINQYTGRAEAIPYNTFHYKTQRQQTHVLYKGKSFPVQVFGDHNLSNMHGAMHICTIAGVKEEAFLHAMKTFRGASGRLELAGENQYTKIFNDFAHSPSKVKATSRAVKDQYKSQTLVGVVELHTYSSLNKEFLKQYQGTMDAINTPLVFFSNHALKMKNLPPLSKQDIHEAFDNDKIIVFNHRNKLEEYLINQQWKHKNLLLMSSGNFNGMDKKALFKHILKQT